MLLKLPLLSREIPAQNTTAVLPHYALLTISALACAVAAQGGYYLPGRVVVAVMVAGALVLALRTQPWSRSDAGLVLLSCTGLAVWAVARAVMGGFPVAAIPTVVTLACLAGAVVVIGRIDSGQRELCAVAAVGVGVLIAITGWIGAAWRIQPWALPVQGIWRASSTLTYANAAAAMLASLSVLACGLLLARPRSLARAAATYALLVGLAATLSRGGLVAMLAGLLLLSVLAGVRATAWHLAPAIAGATVAFGALIGSLPAPAQPRPILAVLGLVVGLMITLALTRLPHRVRAAAVAATLALVTVGFATQIVAGQTMQVLIGDRANLDSMGRSGAAHAAMRMVAARPILGVGPGQARFQWAAADGREVVARYAHNEYLQVLVELGAIGLILLLAVLAAMAIHVRRGRADAQPPMIWAGAVAALAALLVHSGFDFLWQLPVIPLTGGLLVALASPVTSKNHAITIGKEQR